jgi:hypothetical protein
MLQANRSAIVECPMSVEEELWPWFSWLSQILAAVEATCRQLVAAVFNII